MKTSVLRRFAPPLLLILLYWAFGLSYLTVLPRVYQDEPWLASNALKLARQGVLAGDLLKGFERLGEPYYELFPVYPMALATVYRIADVGLFQSRWLGIVCGVLTLSLTFSLAQRIWHDPRIGSVAILLLLAVRWFGETKLHPTGILFLDATRVARYDVLVPVLALLATHAFLSAQSETKRAWYFVIGLLVGLAGLTHFYGLFLLPVFMLLMLWRRERGWLPQLALLLVGVVVAWLPYFAYVLGHLSAWQIQIRPHSSRFALDDPQWYLENLRTEKARYALGLGRLCTFILRPGVWFSFLALSFTWLALTARVRTEHRARVVFVSLTLLPIAYAFLLPIKFINYLLLILPFAALVTGWGIVNAWSSLARSRTWHRAGIALCLFLILLEASSRVVAFQAQAVATTSYTVLNARLRASVPPGSRVLGLHDHWFGWDAYEYRSIAVPLKLIIPELNDAPPTLSEAMNAWRPDYILLDDPIRLFLSERRATIGRDLTVWMQQHNAVRVVDFTDSSYGRFEIYHVERAQ